MPHHYLVHIPMRETSQAGGFKYNHRIKSDTKNGPGKAVARVYMRVLPEFAYQTVTLTYPMLVTASHCIK